MPGVGGALCWFCRSQPAPLGGPSPKGPSVLKKTEPSGSVSALGGPSPPGHLRPWRPEPSGSSLPLEARAHRVVSALGGLSPRGRLRPWRPEPSPSRSAVLWLLPHPAQAAARQAEGTMGQASGTLKEHHTLPGPRQDSGLGCLVSAPVSQAAAWWPQAESPHHTPHSEISRTVVALG